MPLFHCSVECMEHMDCVCNRCLVKALGEYQSDMCRQNTMLPPSCGENPMRFSIDGSVVVNVLRESIGEIDNIMFHELLMIE